MDMKTIRKKTGLSQQKFGKKYGIPLRTIQSWEGGEREAPAYVLELLNFRVESEWLAPMGYVVANFNGDHKEVAIFSSEDEAVSFATAKWESLAEAQKFAYQLSNGSVFAVFFCRLVWDGERFMPGSEEKRDIIWSAI